MRIVLPLLATLIALPALADPIEDRQAIMKERSSILRTLGPIVQGRAEFDGETVMTALEELNANAQRHDIEAFYPDGSQGGDAAPTVWSDREGFIEANETYVAAVASALEAAPADLEALQQAFAPVGRACGACHETYRVED